MRESAVDKHIETYCFTISSVQLAQEAKSVKLLWRIQLMHPPLSEPVVMH